MVVTYHIEGTIEVDLSKEEIKELNSNKYETMKKAYLEKILESKLKTCSMTAEHELDVKVDFDNVYIKKDWDRYAGNMKAKNEQYGSPLGISIEGISTTPYEEYENAMIEIGKRKKNKKSYT